MAQLQLISIRDIVGNMAGKDPVQKIADFDRHHIFYGLPAPDAFARGNADAHRTDSKRNADGISRSPSEVFAYRDLTHETASLEKAKKLFTIITNVNYIIYFAYLHYVSYHVAYLHYCYQ